MIQKKETWLFQDYEKVKDGNETIIECIKGVWK